MGACLYSPEGTHSFLLCETGVGGGEAGVVQPGVHSKAGAEKKKAPGRANTNTA